MSVSELKTCSSDKLGNKQHIIWGIYRATGLSTDESASVGHGTNTDNRRTSALVQTAPCGCSQRPHPGGGGRSPVPSLRSQLRLGHSCSRIQTGACLPLPPLLSLSHLPCVRHYPKHFRCALYNPYHTHSYILLLLHLTYEETEAWSVIITCVRETTNPVHL